VIQLLDRHSRDCAAVAKRFDVPHAFVPDAVPGSPFTFAPVMRRRYWRESALWWPETRTLVVGDAVATNRFYTGDKEQLGVHLLLRLKPPMALGRFEPAHLLVGHGEGVHGSGTPEAIRRALARSRRDLPQVVLRLPFAGRSRQEV
jgi:hypothetical protein